MTGAAVVERHVGVVVQNVGSAATIAEVFETGLPLVERIVTVTGRGVRRPANLIVPVGMKVRDLVAACGGFTDDAREIVFGGPMMGLAQASLDTPVLKGTTGVVVLSEREMLEGLERLATLAADVKRVANEHMNPAKLVYVFVGHLPAIKGGDGKSEVKIEDFGPVQDLPLPDPLTLERPEPEK